MPLILDEMPVDGLEIYGFQENVVVTVQKIRPTANDGDKFPITLIGESLNVLSVYPMDSNVNPFYLNTTQMFQYMKSPQGQTVEVYGRTHRTSVKCTDSPRSELHIIQHGKDRHLSIGYFKLDNLKQWIDSVYAEHPEFFT